MAKERTPICPNAHLYHNSVKFIFEVELPGVSKEDIDLEMTEEHVSLVAPKKDVEYCGCWILALKVDLEEVKATFKNGLLSVTAPLKTKLEGKKIKIE